MEVIGQIDVRAALPAIRVPTLVLHRADDATISSAMGRVIADAIPGATFVELPGADHLPWTGDTEALISEIEQFMTGHRSPESAGRVLATILAIDLVISERAASRLGAAGRDDARSKFEKAVSVEASRFDGHLGLASANRFRVTFQGPARAVSCAHAMKQAASTLGVNFRAGIHTGDCEAGDRSPAGIAVEIADRVADRALPGEVLVSSTVRDLMAGSGVVLISRGRLPAGDSHAEWQLHSVTTKPSRGAAVRIAGA
jgi:class 3 adenylate cyclase